MNTKKISSFVSFCGNKTFTYCNPEEKDKFHRMGKSALREIASGLGLNKSGFDVRSNKAGIACSGEVTLHAENFYLQINPSTVTRKPILLRHCNGRKDYSGGRNNHLELSEMEKVDFLDKIHQVCLDNR